MSIELATDIVTLLALLLVVFGIAFLAFACWR